MRDGMRIDWDVPITMDDGARACAPTSSVPSPTGRYPVILTYGPYAKGLAFQDGYPSAWQRMVAEHPDVACRLEQPVPELGSRRSREVGARRLRLRARGLARRGPLARASSIRSRRARRRTSTSASSGRACSRGRTARSGSTASPTTASTSGRSRRCQPPHLAAMCVWEGAADWYRDMTHHGGILNTFFGQLVRHAGEDGAVRPRRARAGEPRDAASSSAATRPCPTRSSPRTAATSATTSSRIRSTTSITARARRSGRRSPCRSSPRRTGAARACIRAATSKGFVRAGLEGEVARGARPRALDALLHRLRRRTSRSASSAIS